MFVAVALRKESVDRKGVFGHKAVIRHQSLSARRAWIEKHWAPLRSWYGTVALRKESVDRKLIMSMQRWIDSRRSPQGERG